MFTLNCKGKLLSLEKPVVMGILNATPDSFYKGYLNNSHEEILKLVEKMVAEGAGIIDIGGQSTRPAVWCRCPAIPLPGGAAPPPRAR